MTARFHTTMRTRLQGALIGCAVVLAILAPQAWAASLDSPNRVELKRADLSGAPDMEIVESVTEYQPGDSIPVHIHHGIETAYVLQGATVQIPGKSPMKLETGSAIMNLRDVKHGGFTVIGSQSLKLLTVHVVDKGKPLYDEAP